MVLEGEVEIDGEYSGGHVRPANKAEERVDRRLKVNRSPSRLCALAIRQPGFLGRTYTRIIREEDSDAAWSAVRDHVCREAKVYADEHGSYNDIIGLNRMGRVNQSKAYSSEDGTNTNLIGFLSRIQRVYVGVHHRFSTR